MIDTNKYEGHTEGPWTWWEDEDGGHFQVEGRGITIAHDICNNGTEPTMDVREATTKLIADAPLLLAEVERLRKQLQLLHDTWFTDAEMASDVDERMTTLLKEMIE